MKRVYLLALAIFSACPGVFAQGKISLVNDANHLIYLSGLCDYSNPPTNPVPGGVTLMVDLYGGVDASTMTYQTTTPLSSTSPGLFGPVNFISTNLVGGVTATMQVKVRNSAYPTGEAAQLGESYYGYSQIFTMRPSSTLVYNSIVNTGGTALSTWAAGAISVYATPWGGSPTALPFGASTDSYLLGTNVTFSVVLEGSLPLRLQWRKDGKAFGSVSTFPTYAGSFAYLTLTNLTLMDAGSYDVVVTNCLGSVTRYVATVQVLPTNAPSIKVNNQVAVGTVASSVPANISITGGFSGGQIFYTLDGSPPVTGATLYTGAFSISNSCTLRATSVSADLSQGSEAPPVTVMVASSPLAGGQLKNPRKSGSDFVCDLNAAAFRSYRIQYSTNLVDWSDLVVLTNQTGTVSFTNTMDNTSRYYRAMLLP